MVGYIFAACWIGVYCGMFSLAKTKLPTYVTPAYPALAMIVAAYVVGWSQGRLRPGVWILRFAYGTLAVVGIGICIGLPIAARQLLPGEIWLGVFGIVPLIAAVCGYIFAVRNRPGLSAASLAACAALLPLVAFGYIAPRVSQRQPVDRLLQQVAESSDRAVLAAHRTHEPSWVFYAGQPIPTIGHRDPDEVGAFLRNPDAFLITTERALVRLDSQLPPDVKVIAPREGVLARPQSDRAGANARGRDGGPQAIAAGPIALIRGVLRDTLRA